MFLYIASFIQQTEIYHEKKKKKQIQSLESKLDIWNQSSSASVKYTGNQSSLGNTPGQPWIGGETGEEAPQPCFFTATFLV